MWLKDGPGAVAGPGTRMATTHPFGPAREGVDAVAGTRDRADHRRDRVAVATEGSGQQTS
jgi:hypothetical protein